jgi:hypothetical protein
MGLRKVVGDYRTAALKLERRRPAPVVRTAAHPLAADKKSCNFNGAGRTPLPPTLEASQPGYLMTSRSALTSAPPSARDQSLRPRGSLAGLFSLGKILS